MVLTNQDELEEFQQSALSVLAYINTLYGLVTPYGYRDLGQHWLR